VNGILDDFDAAEVRPVVAPQKLVVIAGYVDDACAFACLAQNFLHDVIVGLRPIPGRTQCPAVDDIADQIKGVGFVMAEKVEQLFRLAAARSQMYVGNEQRAKSSRGVVRHGATISDPMIMRDIYSLLISFL
jgi:hypothetical protein